MRSYQIGVRQQSRSVFFVNNQFYESHKVMLPRSDAATPGFGWRRKSAQGGSASAIRRSLSRREAAGYAIGVTRPMSFRISGADQNNHERDRQAQAQRAEDR